MLIGTELIFVPGIIVGGNFTFDCGLERGISYFLETLVCIAPLSKLPTHIIFTGVTFDNFGASIDTIRFVNPNILKLFDSNLEVDIKVNNFLFCRSYPEDRLLWEGERWSFCVPQYFIITVYL